MPGRVGRTITRMQIDSLASSVLIPSPRSSAGHASFDVLELSRANGSTARVGLVPGQRFYQQRGRSYEDAVEGAQALAVKTGTAQVILAAHPGLLFVVPAFLRDATTQPVSSAKLGADLASLAGFTPSGRNGAVWAVVGSTSVIDMRELAPTLGAGRG